jgi:sortase A
MELTKPVKRKDKFPRIYFIVSGIILLIIALIIPISTFTPVFKAEISYQLNQKKSKPTEIIPINTEFSIVIPKINANAKVIKNVDAFDSKIYQQTLTKGVAHAKNTSTPDRSGNTFIFAHSAGNWYQANQFNAVFYLLNKLEVGDEIILYYQSQKYIYSVQESKLVKGDELNYMESKTNQKQLTLMTCWPPGTTLKRLVVIATLKND